MFIKNQIKYFLLGIIVILFSSPLGYSMINMIYANKNLTGSFDILLNGFIHSFMLVGVLIFMAGLVNMFVEKNHK
ncbi:hypothetical protein [Romboutsia lituseburensis]|uniref:hypothetical protein n=1 Tax=Romboutsia lituseburensis TaxID=1537 RepID=UPI00215ABEA4|nr:hypothetical protein [Romboutsia lituseburensis]MCR8744234.1 hypothetical protein [Romboutsia lituseburensis]